MDWQNTLESFHFFPLCQCEFCLCICVRSFVDELFCERKKERKNVVRGYYSLSRGFNEQHTFNMSRRKMSWKVFILMLESMQQQQPFKKIYAIHFGVQEHLVFHGNRVNRKLNVFEASCISVVQFTIHKNNS